MHEHPFAQGPLPLRCHDCLREQDRQRAQRNRDRARPGIPHQRQPEELLAAEVTRLRLAVEEARRRLGMGFYGAQCGRDTTWDAILDAYAILSDTRLPDERAPFDWRVRLAITRRR